MCSIRMEPIYFANFCDRISPSFWKQLAHTIKPTGLATRLDLVRAWMPNPIDPPWFVPVASAEKNRRRSKAGCRRFHCSYKIMKCIGGRVYAGPPKGLTERSRLTVSRQFGEVPPSRSSTQTVVILLFFVGASGWQGATRAQKQNAPSFRWKLGSETSSESCIMIHHRPAPPNGWPIAGTSILGKTMSLYV